MRQRAVGGGVRAVQHGAVAFVEQHVVAGFDVQGLQAARDAGEHGRQRKHPRLQRMRAVAQIAQPIGIFAQAQRQPA
ncbi:hypothetical protein G6F46_015521 [Rhizopus delemar]|nr:hypothetical protein G6F46_015521 [Rhizopus delemar]